MLSFFDHNARGEFRLNLLRFARIGRDLLNVVRTIKQLVSFFHISLISVAPVPVCSAMAPHRFASFQAQLIAAWVLSKGGEQRREQEEHIR